MLYFQRPEYPYHEESALMSIMFLLSQMFRGNFIKEQLIDSPIVRPIQDTIYLDKKISELYSTTIPKKIIQSVDFFYPLICLFIEPPFDRAIKQLKQLSSQWATRRDGKDRKSNSSNSSNHIEGNLLNILCSVVLLFCLKVAMLVPLILFVTGFYLYGLSIYVYLGIERIFQFICQNIFYPSVIIICSLKSGIDSTSYFPLVGLEKEF
ncbi:19385_t:CDS:2 [Gigaspora margarita]|uniref:19385_t:CDS:1 n=1 Tax=Gigaspora margarita TaxID=4874 RepID=A0ABN7UU16_GIGMA|nr:19385_t:CDS:2 [Gigaspora margarita]